MGQIKRKEARDFLFGLLFETEFRGGEENETIFESSCENREIPENKYIKDAYFGICEKAVLLDDVISRYARGWRSDRLSKVSRTVIRIAVYEILFMKDIPTNVSVSEAVELSKKYGEDKARAFVNGVLSGFVKDVAARGIDAVIKGTDAKSANESAQTETTSADEELVDKSTADKSTADK